MAPDLRRGGRAPERRAEALDPDALRDVLGGPSRHPAEADRPHPRVPPWARAGRSLVAGRDRAERGVGGSGRAACTDGGDGLPGAEAPRVVWLEDLDRVPRGEPASL